jgi:hypothetical protein
MLSWWESIEFDILPVRGTIGDSDISAGLNRRVPPSLAVGASRDVTRKQDAPLKMTPPSPP